MEEPGRGFRRVGAATLHAGRRVLLVEDNPVNQEVADCLLKGAGLIVEAAEDGARAVEMATGSHYDVILMDMQMPVMDGLAATRRDSCPRRHHHTHHRDDCECVRRGASCVSGSRHERSPGETRRAWPAVHNIAALVASGCEGAGSRWTLIKMGLLCSQWALHLSSCAMQTSSLTSGLDARPCRCRGCTPAASQP